MKHSCIWSLCILQNHLLLLGALLNGRHLAALHPAPDELLPPLNWHRNAPHLWSLLESTLVFYLRNILIHMYHILTCETEDSARRLR